MKSTNLDANAMNALFCASDKNEFNPVSTSTFAHQIWYTLHVTHEGANKVKETKIFVLVQMLELFQMKKHVTTS